MRSTRHAISALATAAALSGLALPAAGAAVPTSPYTVTLSASTKVATAGHDDVVLTGVVVPKPPADSLVTVQARYEGKQTWRKIGTAVIKPNGKYRFVDKPSTRFDREYRVVKKADEKGLADKSRTREVKVFAWSYLTQWARSADENVFVANKLPINGDDYSHTLFTESSYDSGFAEFTLGRKCTTLETTFGLSDRTETGGQAAIGLKLDGASAYLRTFNLGESDSRTVDVTGVYRMRVDFAQVTTTPDTEPAAGEAQVLCD